MRLHISSMRSCACDRQICCICLRLTATRSRQALRYIIRNTTLPQRTRAVAQLQLTQMHVYTRPTQIRNRCMMSGKGRGVLSDFKMARVCLLSIQCDMTWSMLLHYRSIIAASINLSILA